MSLQQNCALSLERVLNEIGSTVIAFDGMSTGMLHVVGRRWWCMQWEVRPLIYEKLRKWRHGHYEPFYTSGYCCGRWPVVVYSVHRSWLVGGCVDDLLSDHQYNFLWSGTALLYLICRNEKERQRSHCSLSKIPVWRRKSRNNPTPPRSVRYGVPFPNIRISWPLVPRYVCLFVCYYYCCCFCLICNHLILLFGT